VSEHAYQWGHEHFCEPDVVALNDADRDRAVTLGYPVQLEAELIPATFCSVCLKWWTEPHPEGVGTPTPQPKETDE
jgi:hypothetical protein